MASPKQNKNLIVFPWHYLIVTIVLYLGVLCSFGINWIAIGVLTVIWYPYLCYYLTYVKFYDAYMTIRHPLFIFWSKKIMYENIASMKQTDGKGTMIKVFLTKERNAWTYSPPLMKKKHERMVEVLDSKGIKL